jgi:hypothetical protein
MKITSKQVHAVILAFLFSIVNWLIVKNLIIEITFIKWIFIEILFAFSMKLYNFTVTKIH